MLASKLSSITPSVTIGISTKVKEMAANGVNVTNLSIGEPDFFTPEKAKESAIEAIKANKTKYDAASGLVELRKEISTKLKRDNAITYDADQIVVSSGAKHAITNALLAILDPGDEVVIPVPYWVSYPEMVKLTGGSPVFVKTQKENGFKMTRDEFEKSITDKTRAVFITNPSNPTGSVYSKEELLPICQLAAEKGIYIIADEIYEKIVYDGKIKSIASLSEEIYDKTITINGFSKSVSMTGWRLGYSATNKKLAKAMATIQGHLVSHPATITQYAGLNALRECEADTNRMIETYAVRRDFIIDFFEKECKKLDLLRPDGAFYGFIDISSLREYFPDTESLSVKVCEDLLEKERVAFVPGMAFGTDDFIRMSYAASLENIKTGLDKLKHYVDNLGND